ncbi:MAG: transcriptional regulator [Gammaproteobacteria bacterium]|nr:transcriptional regulator [Gammaproteobacteria bacterium]
MSELAAPNTPTERNSKELIGGSSLPKNKNKNKNKKNSRASLIETLLLFSALPAIYYGWSIREEEIFAAEMGWGYSLGIIGGVMMLVLMLYPLRKHAKFMRNLGQVRYWFRLHMALGILGPVAVLYHANFDLGSINSNVALISMLVVACSGVIGRFVYSKIHHGLYGRKATFDELCVELNQAKEKNDLFFSVSSDELMLPLVQFEKKYVAMTGNLFFGVMLLPFLPLFSFLSHMKFKRKIKTEIEKLESKEGMVIGQLKPISTTLNGYSKKYLLNTSRMIEFIVYERIFSLWHTLHLPLFIIMVSTGLFHVYAVHMY